MKQYMPVVSEIEGRLWCNEHGYKYCGTRIDTDLGFVMEYDDRRELDIEKEAKLQYLLMKEKERQAELAAKKEYFEMKEKERQAELAAKKEYFEMKDREKQAELAAKRQYFEMKDKEFLDKKYSFGRDYLESQNKKKKQADSYADEYRKAQDKRRMEDERKNQDAMKMLRNGQFSLNIPELKMWVVISESGYTGKMYVGQHNSYVYQISEAKLFTKQDAQKKAIMMTKNSKSNRIWDVLKIKL